MTYASEWIVVGLLRASLGLSIAALSVAACVRLTRLRAPRAEQWAWLLVLVQGVLLVPVSISVPWDSRGFKTPPPRRQADVIPIDASRPPAEAGRETVGGDEGRAGSPS